MRPSIRGSTLRYARGVPPKISNRTHHNRPASHPSLHILEATPTPARRASLGCIRCCILRIRPHPTNLRLRNQLPHSEVSPSTEYSGAKCLHFSIDPGIAPGLMLRCCVQDWGGLDWGIARFELVVVDHSCGPVCVHFVE